MEAAQHFGDGLVVGLHFLQRRLLAGYILLDPLPFIGVEDPGSHAKLRKLVNQVGFSLPILENREDLAVLTKDVFGVAGVDQVHEVGEAAQALGLVGALEKLLQEVGLVRHD